MPNSNPPSPVAGGGGPSIDIKFLWSMLCTLAIAMMSVGALYFKVDAQAVSLSKIEAKLDARDERITSLTQTVLIQSSKNETQQGSIDRISADLTSLRSDLNSLIYTRKHQVDK